MRILDNDRDVACNSVTLFLTVSEASELRDSLNSLVHEGFHARHEHVTSGDFQKEITVCVYTAEDLAGFDARSRKLILEDR